MCIRDSPHGLTDAEYDTLFTKDKPIIFAYHGYPTPVSYTHLDVYKRQHYTYDTKLASDITSGKVSKYIPDTAATLNSNKGICYDLASLFAAMCRSQDIPCTLTKGYAGSSYHAWNKVNVSGNWYQIDMTYAVTKRVINETSFVGCVSPLKMCIRDRCEGIIAN